MSEQIPLVCTQSQELKIRRSTHPTRRPWQFEVCGTKPWRPTLGGHTESKLMQAVCTLSVDSSYKSNESHSRPIMSSTFGPNASTGYRSDVIAFIQSLMESAALSL